MHAAKLINIEEPDLTNMKERTQDGYVFVYIRRGYVSYHGLVDLEGGLR